MTKDIVICNECKFFNIIQGVGMCKHPNALPFPKANDYCSMGEYADQKKSYINSEELLKRVYEQRRSDVY